VDPSPPSSDLAETKARLRTHYRKARREHVASLPDRTRTLLFLRPPSPVACSIGPDSIVGLYHPHPHEAPTLSYARWLHENGRPIALPFFADRQAPMAFRLWSDPYGERLEPGPFGVLQPPAETPEVTPTVLFVPLVAFGPAGERLGQGGGHYDRWIAAHPEARTIGLGWDCQLAHDIPLEPHDRPLDAVVTPTRLFEGAR